MQRQSLFVLIGLIIVGLGWQFAQAQTANVPTVMAAAPTPTVRTITVSGSAEIKVVPDEVRLTFGVRTQGNTLQAARQASDEIIRQVFTMLAANGVDSKYVQSEYLNIYPIYDTYTEPRQPTGYIINKNVSATIKDVSKFENILAGIFESGINQIHNIDFTVSDLRTHRDEARVLAVRAAREKAMAMAQELGQEIGEPLTIQEQPNNDWGWYRWWGSSSGTQNVVQNGGGAATNLDGTMALGQISVTAAVSIEFSLK